MAKTTRAKRRATDRVVVLLAVLLLIAIVLASTSFFHNERWQGFNEQFLLLALEQQSRVQQIANDAVVASRADEAAFARLQGETNEFERVLGTLKEGDPDEGLPGSPQEVEGLLREVEDAWLALREVTEELLGSREQITSVRKLSEATGALLPELGDATRAVAELMVVRGAPAAAVFVATQQSVLIERMEDFRRNLLRGGTATRRGDRQRYDRGRGVFTQHRGLVAGRCSGRFGARE